MREMKYLKVPEDIARRAGVIDTRHRTSDGEFIINESDLRMVRLEPEEYVRGIPAQILTETEAAKLIEEGGNQIGVLEANEKSDNNKLPGEDTPLAENNGKVLPVDDNGKEVSND